MKSSETKLAEFLNWERQNAGKFILPDELLKDSIYAELRTDEELEFKTNHNWLNLVVDKIETTLLDVTKLPEYRNNKNLKEKNITKLRGVIYLFYDDSTIFNGFTYHIELSRGYIVVATSNHRFKKRIDCMFEACVKFVEWYLKYYDKN
jgi:hypothetical protein